MEKYYKRLIEGKIEKKLQSSGAVLVSGPKFVGKTTTCMRFQKSNISLIDDSLINIVEADPTIALKGEFPRLIDEWQNVPNLWNLVRREVDKNGTFGEYILTGSATPLDSRKIHHSGAGRISNVKMRPMSLFESFDSKGMVSLKSLFDEGGCSLFDENEGYSLRDTAYFICRGGWPQAINEDREISLEITKNYYEGLFNFKADDNPEIRNKRPEFFKGVLKSYARNISTQVSYSTMMSDLRNGGAQFDEKTFNSYVSLAKDLFIIEDIEAWSPSLRSKTAIRSTPTRHFLDPSIACLSLGISPDDLLKDARSFGFFFEDMAIRDLRVYAESLGGSLAHYRDKNGLEIDAIVHLEDGRWGAIEIKLGSEEGVQEGEENLLKLESLISEELEKPSFKMVLTACGRAYKKPSGVYVCPINLLKD